MQKWRYTPTVLENSEKWRDIVDENGNEVGKMKRILPESAKGFSLPFLFMTGADLNLNFVFVSGDGQQVSAYHYFALVESFTDYHIAVRKDGTETDVTLQSMDALHPFGEYVFEYAGERFVMEEMPFRHCLIRNRNGETVAYWKRLNRFTSPVEFGVEGTHYEEHAWLFLAAFHVVYSNNRRRRFSSILPS